MAPIKEVEFHKKGVFIKILRSWFVTLEFPPTNKDRVFIGSGKSGKVRDQRKVRGENFYPCKFLTSTKKSHANSNVCS